MLFFNISDNYPSSGNRIFQFNSLLVKMITSGLFALSIVENMGFQHLVIFCVPATSVPSEQLFSKAGELISSKRNRLGRKNVDKILFLNKNM